MRGLLVPVVGLLLVCACSEPKPAADSHADMPSPVKAELTPPILAALARMRDATTAFHDLDTAKGAGYMVWSPDPFATNATCPTNAAGNMGYHLVNVSLRGNAADPAAGDAVIDELQPEMLLYEKGAGGKLRLVGVEYLVFTTAWERVHGGGASPPHVFGQPLLASSHSFAPGGPDIPHYELHAWVWKDNPRGMFDPWNPAVTC